MKHVLSGLHRSPAPGFTAFRGEADGGAATNPNIPPARAREDQLEMRRGGKPNDFLSQAIRSGEIAFDCRLSRNLEVCVTVKFKNKTPRKFLPSDLPSKSFAGIDACR